MPRRKRRTRRKLVRKRGSFNRKHPRDSRGRFKRKRGRRRSRRR